ncbi:hypothetical protein TL16_g06417 [Triparma laevis f. inornata]|uniref:Kinesin light chain n=1 Tax=Triparma laevis f. inornata TaxID=1714386 RepID=A0A9W7EAH2_9STRA|nr:hypothetical protein TL16_g06417 [Triparma laevis f. inornata]
MVVAWRRILEVLVLAMPPVEKKVQGKKKQKKKKKAYPRKVEIFYACYALGIACGNVRDYEDARRYRERAKEGYEEQLGRDNEKALATTRSLIAATGMSKVERIEKLRDLVKRIERALGEENDVLETLNSLGNALQMNEQFEEATEVWERCLAERTKMLGEDHKNTLMMMNNLGIVYEKLKNYEKAMEYYERALEGNERLIGKTHPDTISTAVNFAVFCVTALHDFEKAEPYFERALEGR